MRPTVDTNDNYSSEDSVTDELFRVLQEALGFALAACELDNDSEMQLACEQYDKSILYMDEILGKLPSDAEQYFTLLQLRNAYDDRMEYLKNFDNSKQEPSNVKNKSFASSRKKRQTQKAFEEDERLLHFSTHGSSSPNISFEAPPEAPIKSPYWHMRLIQKSISNGVFMTESIFVPACIWSQVGVKFCGLSIKNSAFQAIAGISKEINFCPDGQNPVVLSWSPLLLKLRSASEEMILIQNQLSKPFLFIQEVQHECSAKSPGVRGQIALSRFTSVFAAFGKNVINFAEVNFQRLGTMPTRVSEEDFSAYTSLIVTMCESGQVFDNILDCVEVYLRKLIVSVKANHTATRSQREGGEDGSYLASDEGISNNSDPAPNYYPNLSKTFPDVGPLVAALSGSERDQGLLSTTVMAEIRVCEDILATLAIISDFMRDVVCGILSRDTEALMLRYLHKTRKSFSRMHWDEESGQIDEHTGMTDF